MPSTEKQEATHPSIHPSPELLLFAAFCLACSDATLINVELTQSHYFHFNSLALSLQFKIKSPRYVPFQRLNCHCPSMIVKEVKRVCAVLICIKSIVQKGIECLGTCKSHRCHGEEILCNIVFRFWVFFEG